MYKTQVTNLCSVPFWSLDNPSFAQITWCKILTSLCGMYKFVEMMQAC